ncbi:MAG TPA: methylenetetrahydrofolate reductase [Bdellovibrionales bacterium]|nr:methylenetetrahydrofolate reductase [Bdellovibrionales bacterium]
MKVIEHIESARAPSFSFEIIPPPRGRTVRDLIEVVETLVPVKPMWIDVTSHSASAYFQEDREGTLRRRTYKKRPGTLGICGIIQNRFKIDTVAHILCLGFSREETEDALIELNYLGVENILALRGDGLNYEKRYSKDKSLNEYACDLVKQVDDLKKGHYIDDISNSEPMDFCVGVAGYPEKHFEAANLKTDLQYLKQKVDAGADYIVTQMFFDNEPFYRFVGECRAIGIKVPIIPGLKVLRSLNQLKSIPKTFHVDLPDAMVDEIMASPGHVVEIGKRWATKQVHDLVGRGHQCLHFYVMQDANVVTQIVETVK